MPCQGSAFEIRLLPIPDRGKLTPAFSARPMAIIIDPSIAKSQAPREPSPPPSQPPPSYTESAATQPLVVQPGPSSVPHVHEYGPTPIGQQHAILPYYDPRSVHSVEAAKRRAKERFVGAVLWVVLIFALFSVCVWMDVMIQLGWWVPYCPFAADQALPSLSRPYTSQCLLSYVISYTATYVRR